MSEPHDPNPAPGGGIPPSGRPFSQDIHHAAVSARVPENVRRGVFCSAVMVLQCNDDFVIDFLSMIVPPQQVVARVVMSAATFSKLVGALQINVAEYQRVFGPLSSHEPLMTGAIGPSGETKPAEAAPAAATEAPAGPTGTSAGGPPPSGQAASAVGHAAAQMQPPPSSGEPTDIAELYNQLKLPDELLGGTYATGAMIRHTPREFAIDFLTNFYPRAVVTARIFLASGRILSFLETFQNSLARFRQGPPSQSGPLLPG